VEVIVVRAGTMRVAVPLDVAVEAMRPLPVSPLAGAPPWLCGLAVVRGGPTPVVDLPNFLSGAEPGVRGRYLTVRAGRDRTVALSVDAVDGVRRLPDGLSERLPPLSSLADTEAVTALGRADGGLLLVLDAARVLDDEAWATLHSR
jgi:purine-binding chemotaxis protein CheW